MDAGGVPQNQIATTVWANPTRSLTALAGVTTGQKLQPFAQLVAAPVNAVATTSILTYSATGGVVLAVSVLVSTALSANTMTAFLDIIQDSNTTSFPLYTALNIWDTTGKSLSDNFSGTGSGAADYLHFVLNVSFTTSIVVQFRITATTEVSGNITFTVFWAHP